MSKKVHVLLVGLGTRDAARVRMAVGVMLPLFAGGQWSLVIRACESFKDAATMALNWPELEVIGVLKPESRPMGALKADCEEFAHGLTQHPNSPIVSLDGKEVGDCMSIFGRAAVSVSNKTLAAVISEVWDKRHGTADG